MWIVDDEGRRGKNCFVMEGERVVSTWQELFRDGRGAGCVGYVFRNVSVMDLGSL